MKLDKERESYLQYVLIEQHLTMNTKESYRLELEKYCNFLKKNNITDIKEVKINHITEYLGTLKKQEISPQSIAHAITAIKNFHKYFLKSSSLPSLQPSRTADKEAVLRWRIPEYLRPYTAA